MMHFDTGRVGGRVLAALSAGLLLLVQPAAWAQTATPATDSETLVVTATHAARDSFDLPVSIDVVRHDAIVDQQLTVNLSESLAVVPGLVIQNRQNYAQDEQLSIRGFGARATFGVTSVRLYEDGIPATMPDGQGQTSHFDLPSTARIEVLRGPFSALYGNSSGGVIALFTVDGGPETVLASDAVYGSFNTRHLGTTLSGALGDMGYMADFHDFATDGYRQHSAAARDNANVKLSVPLDGNSHLTMIANTLDMPNAEDAMGLTKAQFDANPAQAGTGAIPFNTRKGLDQEQVGLALDTAVSAFDDAHVVLYGGHRWTEQFQSIPVATESSLADPGGVVKLNRAYFGTDANWTAKRHIGDVEVRATAGVSVDQLDEARRGYQNFIGTELGVQGALRRNEDNIVSDFDQYLQVEIDPSPDWLMMAGVRQSAVWVSDHDHYITAGDGDTSGGTTYGATSPVAGLTWKWTKAIHMYAAYGQGFETPTLTELAYRSTGGSDSGFNFALKPSRSNNFEGGIKTMWGPHGTFDLTGFHIATQDELAVQAASNGRSVYQNVGGTRRDGLETSLADSWDNGVSVRFAYAYLNADYSSAFKTCPLTPCVTILVPAGTRMLGVPKSNLYGEAAWRHAASGFSSGLEMSAKSAVTVNDPGTQAAPGYIVFNLRGGFDQHWGHWVTREFVRVENVTDHRYAGSVIVNDSNGRYFEPAAVRAAYAGLNAGYTF